MMRSRRAAAWSFAPLRRFVQAHCFATVGAHALCRLLQRLRMPYLIQLGPVNTRIEQVRIQGRVKIHIEKTDVGLLNDTRLVDDGRGPVKRLVLRWESRRWPHNSTLWLPAICHCCD